MADAMKTEWRCVQWAAALAAVPTYENVPPPRPDETIFSSLYKEKCAPQKKVAPRKRPR